VTPDSLVGRKLTTVTVSRRTDLLVMDAPP